HRRVVVIRDVQELAGLAADGVHHRRVAVAEAVHRDAGEEVEIPLAVDVPHRHPLAAGDGERLARVEADLVGGIAGEDVVTRHGETPRAAQARASRRRGRRTPCTTSVPTPWLVRTSSSKACFTRPSMTWACFTPPRSASMQHSIFGIMPPSMM